MIKRLKESVKRNKVVVLNFGYLSVLEITTMLLPLITYPYLIRVLGIEMFGLIAFSQAVIAYFITVVNFGFNTSAVRDISIHRNNKDKIERVFSSIILIKLLLALLSLILLVALVFFVEKFNENWEIHIGMFGMVLGHVFYPFWFFQGIEKTKYVTVVDFIAKLVSTIIIFSFINVEEDYMLLVAIKALTLLLVSISLLIITYKKFGVVIKKQRLEILVQEFRLGWHIFVSNVFVNLYSTTNIVVLGLVTNNTMVGNYEMANRVCLALKSIFTSLNKALYPHLSRKYNESKDVLFNLIRKISFYIFGGAFLTATLCFIFSKKIILIVSGSINEESTLILKILMLLLIVDPFGGLYSNGLFIRGRQKLLLKATRMSAVFSFLAVYPVVYYYKAVGLSMLVVIINYLSVYLARHYFYKEIQEYD